MYALFAIILLICVVGRAKTSISAQLAVAVIAKTNYLKSRVSYSIVLHMYF